MKRLIGFVKTTLIGGLLVLLPIYLAVLLLAKAVGALAALVAPLTAPIPATMEFRQALGIALIVAVCFLVGLALRTAAGVRAMRVIETRALERIPGYALVRGMVGRVADDREGAPFQPVLVEIEDALVPGFMIEETGDGRSVVLVPSVPTPAAGAVYIIDSARVHVVDVPFATAVKVITRWGSGAGELVKAMRR